MFLEFGGYSMKFVAAKCPSCGANIQVDEDRKKCFCQFCGSQIFVEEAIQMIKGTVQIDFKNQIDNFLIRANEFMEQKRYSDAEIYFNKVLDIDATNKEAKEGLAITESIVTSNNIFIERCKIRPAGEVKTLLYINGQKVKVDLDHPANLMLPVGTHKIEFKRGICQSKPIHITINNRYDSFSIRFTPKLFTISAELV